MSGTKEATDKYRVRFAREVFDENNPVFLALVKHCQRVSVRELGARGIGKAMNKLLNGSLSNYFKTYILRKETHLLSGMELNCRLSDEYLEMMNDENLDDNKKEMTVDHIIWS